MSEYSPLPRPKPLAGIRVLDLTRLLPGPVATLHLADLGASVTKIEGPGAEDYARDMGDGPDGVSHFYRAVNRNKRGLRLDLKRPEGREIFLRLVARSHVVIESFRPGVTDRLGIGYEALKAVNPAIVYCAITGYGQNGPLAQAAGHDLNYIGYAGLLDQIGSDGGLPAIPNLQVGDLLGGAMNAVMGILAALFDARSSGTGRMVDVSMTDGVLAHNLFPLFAWQSSGQVPERGGDMLTGGDPWYGVYETRDGRHMAVAPLEEKFWQRFCDCLERPDLKPLHGSKGEVAKGLRRELEGIFRSQTQQYWTERFTPADCCVTPVLRVDEAVAHPHFVARQMAFRAHGTLQYGCPVKLSDCTTGADRPAPAPGEHSEDILREAGFDAAEITRLRTVGVI